MKKPAKPRILTINGGSSSIKFTQFEAGEGLGRILDGEIDRIGTAEAGLRVTGLDPMGTFSRPVTAPDHTAAVGILMDWIEARGSRDVVTAVGHRVVHGGPNYCEPQRITAEMLAELQWLSPFDPTHLPAEIRVPQTGARGIALKQQLKDKRVEHQRYIRKYGQDMPEIRDWRWGVRWAAEGEAT